MTAATTTVAYRRDVPFRHVAMYRWAAHVGPDHVDRVRTAFDELATLVPGVHVHGSDVGVAEGTFDYLVVADFESVVDWRTYRDHPAHVLLEAELLDEHVVERATGQYQVPDARSAHDVSATRMQAFLTQSEDVGASSDESDDELLARARRAAQAEMQALLAEPDEPV